NPLQKNKMGHSDLIERNEVFDLAFRFVTETSENIFLTGKAGTGKTTFLKYLKDNCSKNIVVAAPTGVAAINAGGVTLHSLFQLPFHPFLPTRNNKDDFLSKLKYNRQRQQLLRKMELLVIDEISMVRCDTMDAIDTILKSVRRRYDVPFGGVQLLCIGDLYQLPPVAQRHEWSILREYYSSPFFFDSNVIKEQMPLLIELDKVYRQKEDSFVSLLNKVRNNNMHADDFEDLHLRYFPDFRPSQEENFITLTSHNNQADLINSRELHKLLAPTFTYNAEIDGDFPENTYPAEGALILKVGAQVMFLKNDAVNKKYFNGKIGIVKSLKDDEIVVECGEEEIKVGKETWENSRYVLNRGDGKLEQETMGTFTQFALRLAWAITIHKSQGLTFEKVMIDAGAAFSSGQVYVALSRCTSLEGIILLSKIPSAAIYSNENVVKGHQSLTHRGSLAERFAGARQIFTQQLLEEVFSFNEMDIQIQNLQSGITLHSGKLNNNSVEWINELKKDFISDKSVGLKFISQIYSLMKDDPVIENNIALQQRIMAAAKHFSPRLETFQKNIQNHPLITEHKEVATVINEHLSQLMLATFTSNYFMQYCNQEFSVSTFLKHRLQFSQPRFNITAYASGRNQSSIDVPNEQLYDTLKRWRDSIAVENNLPIYMVANQASLKEIANYLPKTKNDLMSLAGFGKAKVHKYGDDILEMVESYCLLNDLETNMSGKKNAPVKKKVKSDNEVGATKSGLGDSKIISFNLFKEGKSVEEIAKQRNMTIGTIEGHLSTFIANGEIKINEIVLPEKQLLIKEAVKIHGRESLKVIKENLPEDISYGEIRMVLAAAKLDDQT
ncbi:MAG: helix-turn-helix domain-containing protein, partial [Ginsengibacter sp.]